MTEKRFRVLYSIDENPFEWDILDNPRNAIIEQGNGIAICNELNELHEENQRLKQYIKQVLQRHLNGWRGVYNPIDESLVVEINVVKSIAEDLGVDLE